MSLTDIKTAFFIAYKIISRGHKSTVALLIFILSLSFFNLMFISGILSGFSSGVLETMINTATSHLILMPQEIPSRKDFIVGQDVVRAQLETIPGVLATTRHYQIGGTFAYDKDKNGKLKYVSAPVLGINPAEEKEVLEIKDYMVSGDYPDTLGEDEIIMGANLAGGYGTQQSVDLGGAVVGEKVQVTYSNGIVRTYTIRGIFKVTIGSSSNTAFISTKEAESILSTYNNASEVLVKVNLERNNLGWYEDRIGLMFPTLKIQIYPIRLANVGIIISAFDIISLMVTITNIIVSAVTIFVLIYVNAISKRRQIGILKAIGIKESIIELSYVFQSLFYSIWGIVIGSLIVFVVFEPYLIFNPIKLPFGNAVLVFSFLGIFINTASLVAAGILAGFIPSRIVARENILKAIWG